MTDIKSFFMIPRTSVRYKVIAETTDYSSKMALNVPAITLNNGRKMPLFGLGTWQSKPDDVKVAVRTALDTGYRLIDTAYNYLNEDAIGEVLAEYIKAGKVKREDLFITTKLGSIFTRPSDVEHSMNESLKNLGLTYVDMYLVHAPMAFKKQDNPRNVFPMTKDGKLDLDGPCDIEGVWKEMEKLVDQGKAKSIGISNFNSVQIERVCKNARIKPATNQVECHAYFPQTKLEDYMKKYNISIMAYAPIGSPGRAESGFTDQKDHPVLLKDPVIADLAKKYNKRPAQILLRNLVQRNLIAIPKSVTPSRIKENADIFEFSLTPEDMASIAKIDKGLRMFDMAIMQDNPDYPFGIPV